MLGCPVDRIVDNTTSGGGSCVPQYSVHLKQEKSGADSAADTVIDADIIIMAPSYYRHHQSPSTQNLKFTTVQYSRAIVITSTSSTTPPSLLEYQYITIHPTEDHPNGAQCLYHYVSSSGGEDIILRYFVSLSSTTTTTAQQDLEWAVKLAVSSVETVISQHYYTQSIEEINNGSDEWWGGQDGSLFILPELPPLTTTMNNTSRGASSNEEEEEVYNTGLEVIGGNVFDRAVGVARRLFDKICASSTLTTTVDDGSDSTPVSREFYPLFDYTAVDE